jgi:hypothetical protein
MTDVSDPGGSAVFLVLYFLPLADGLKHVHGFP